MVLGKHPAMEATVKQITVLFLALSSVIAAHQINWIGLLHKGSANDRFTLRILETTVGESEATGFAAITVTTELTNLGRPTTADDFRLVIRQGELRIPTEAVRV